MTADRSMAIVRSFLPKTIAFIGGSVAEMSIRRCVDMGLKKYCGKPGFC